MLALVILTKFLHVLRILLVPAQRGSPAILTVMLCYVMTSSMLCYYVLYLLQRDDGLFK